MQAGGILSTQYIVMIVTAIVVGTQNGLRTLTNLSQLMTELICLKHINEG